MSIWPHLAEQLCRARAAVGECVGGQAFAFVVFVGFVGVAGGDLALGPPQQGEDGVVVGREEGVAGQLRALSSWDVSSS